MSDKRTEYSDDPSLLVEDDVKEPNMYKVFLLNDDYTTMNFVVTVLMEICHKPLREAERIMQEVHNNGIGLCGVYPEEVAETKVNLIRARARQAGYPLRCTMEKA